MKPTVRLVGEDRNAFSIIGRVMIALNRANMQDKAVEFRNKALSAKSYNEVLQLVTEYCEVE